MGATTFFGPGIGIGELHAFLIMLTASEANPHNLHLLEVSRLYEHLSLIVLSAPTW